MSPVPLTYLITGGSTNSSDLSQLLRLAEAAVQAQISYFQIREKQLTAGELFSLSRHVVEVTRGSATKVLINDRVDVAVAAGADGVHLAANSLAADVVRRRFGNDFVIGVSTHSVAEAEQARDLGASFAVFGPVFSTPDKLKYGPPLGLGPLHRAVKASAPLPVFALGGVDLRNFAECVAAGAAGLAGIRIFAEPRALKATANAIRSAAIRS
jgi:thiamine-phosphate pyrophosphorylase